MSISISSTPFELPHPMWRGHAAHGRNLSHHWSQAKPLPFARPVLDDAEIAELKQVVQNGCVAPGPKTAEFERQFASSVGVEHATAVASHADALRLAFEAIGIQSGDEIVTSPYADSTISRVAKDCDARLVFVDIDPDTLNLDPDLLDGAITERTQAIVPNHVAGLPADMERILEIARRYDIRVINDAAQAFPAGLGDRRVGAMGDLTCFSFSAEQPLTTGSGGMVCTSTRQLSRRCRAIVANDAAAGGSRRMIDLAAALGIAQLGKAEAMWHRRLEIAISYNATFSGFGELKCPDAGVSSQHAWTLYPLRLNCHRLHLDRDAFVDALRQRNIVTRLHFQPLHLRPEFHSSFAPESFPLAVQEFEREISLPIFPGMSDYDVQGVIDAVIEIVESHRC